MGGEPARVQGGLTVALTHLRLRYLVAIADGVDTAPALAAHLGCRPENARVVVAGLRREGYARARRPGRRKTKGWSARRITITDKGRAALGPEPGRAE